MTGDIEKVVTEHAVTLGVLVHSIKKIEGFMEKTMESQLKQEVIMERLANFEEVNGNDHKHIHSRIDSIKQSIDNHVTEYETKCDLVSPKANNGQMAYNIIKWTGVTFGTLLAGTMFAMFLKAIKVWG
jgi:hypothetical protein